MTEPLTSAEWDALHRAMDRLDRARHAAEPQGPNEARVREAVLAAYQEQGVEVNARDVERAVKEALPKRPVFQGRWSNVYRSPSPVLAWTRARGWKPSLRWDGKPWQAPFVDHRGPFDWVNSKLDEWKWKVQSLEGHVPLDDDALSERLADAARHQIQVYESDSRWLWLFGIAAMVSFGSAWWVGSLALGGLGIVFVFGLLASAWSRLEARDALGHLGQALEAIQDKDWEHSSFALCLPQVGLVHAGSLRPIPIKSMEWLTARGRAEPYSRLHSTIARWEHSRALRVNDALVMQRMIHVQANHPLESFYKAATEKLKKWWPGMNRGR